MMIGVVACFWSETPEEGSLNGGLANTGGTFANTGTINGGATVTGGTVTNNNLISGTVDISAAGIVNNNLTIENNVVVNRGPRIEEVEKVSGKTGDPAVVSRVRELCEGRRALVIHA